MDSFGSEFGLMGMFLRVCRSSYHLDSYHGHLLLVNLNVEEVEGHCVIEDSLDFDAGLAENIHFVEGSFAREDHGVDIRHGKVIVAVTSYEWEIYFSLGRDNANIFCNERTHGSFHAVTALRIHRDVMDNLVEPKKRSEYQLEAACLAADSKDFLGCTYLVLSSLIVMSAFESVTRKVSENVRDEESGYE